MGCRFLVNLLAFFPDKQDIIPADQLPAGVQELFITTQDHERLQCYWIPVPGASRLLIYFHGNAGNIGHRLPDLRILADMGLNVLGVGYRGYGKSTGKPSEQGIYSDGRAALAYAQTTLGFAPGRTLLLGRSIGTTVALELCRNTTAAGVILVSPLTSGKAVGKAGGFGFLTHFAGDAFNNLAKIRSLKSPLLILHGTADDIIPFDMGRQLYELAREPKQLVSLEGAGHNDISTTWAESYWKAIQTFIDNPPRRQGLAKESG